MCDWGCETFWWTTTEICSFGGIKLGGGEGKGFEQLSDYGPCKNYQWEKQSKFFYLKYDKKILCYFYNPSVWYHQRFCNNNNNNNNNNSYYYVQFQTNISKLLISSKPVKYFMLLSFYSLLVT